LPKSPAVQKIAYLLQILFSSQNAIFMVILLLVQKWFMGQDHMEQRDLFYPVNFGNPLYRSFGILKKITGN
jgi:hypothetical protein